MCKTGDFSEKSVFIGLVVDWSDLFSSPSLQMKPELFVAMWQMYSNAICRENELTSRPIDGLSSTRPYYVDMKSAKKHRKQITEEGYWDAIDLLLYWNYCLNGPQKWYKCNSWWVQPTQLHPNQMILWDQLLLQCSRRIMHVCELNPEQKQRTLRSNQN